MGLVKRRRAIAGGAAIALLATLACAAPPPSEVPVTVYAAASLHDVLAEVGATYTRQHGTQIRYSFEASSALARQIEAGASADLYLSADEDWMDYLAERSLIETSSRRDLLGNRLVLIAPAQSPSNLKIAPGFALAAALGPGRLSIADPDSVPAGRYARAALSSLGVWTQLENHLVRADNVRSAMRFVALGEAPFGIVYETDARLEPRVRIVDRFPTGSHPPIRYPLALLVHASPAARAFASYLAGAEARTVFERYGFGPPQPAP